MCGRQTGIKKLSEKLKGWAETTAGGAATQGASTGAPGRGARAITARLRHAVETGVFSDGDKMPAERDLSTAFSCARSTVRKALDQLEAEGLVSRRVGSGTFVTYEGPLRGQAGDISELISPLQLVETRFALEPHIARLAAIHATRRDLEVMEAVLLKLEACGDDKELFTQLDGEFHVTIARSARNPLLLQLYEQVNDIRKQALWGVAKEKVLLAQKISDYNVQHRGIYTALCRRDSRDSAERVREHLGKARDDLVGVETV